MIIPSQISRRLVNPTVTNLQIHFACFSLLPFGTHKPRSNVPVTLSQRRSVEPSNSLIPQIKSKAISNAWFSFKQIFPKHRVGVGKIKLNEGEKMFMKMYSKDEHDLKGRQHLFVGHYLWLGCVGSMFVTSDLFLFDIITLVSIALSLGVVNRKLHKKCTPYVLEVVLLPDDRVRIRNLTWYGGSKTRVIPVEDCNFGDLEHFTRIDGEEFKILFPKSMLFIDESDLRKYDLHEKAMRHKKYISPFSDIDQVHSSKNLFGKKRAIEELHDDQSEFVKIANDESLQTDTNIADKGS